MLSFEKVVMALFTVFAVSGVALIFAIVVGMWKTIK